MGRGGAPRTRPRGQRQVGEDLPLGAPLAQGRDHGRGPLRVRHHLQRLVRGGEVAALEHVGGRQHVVGVRGGLVAVEVDADDQVEPLESGGQPPARHRVHGIAGGHEQRPDAVGVLGGDLVGERGDGEGAGHPVPASVGGAVLVEAAQPGQAREAQGVERAARHQQPAAAVEVAGEQVEPLHQPGADRAEGPHVDAGRAVERGPVGRGVRRGELADGGGRHPGHMLGALGGPRGAGGHEVVDAAGHGAGGGQVDADLAGHHVQHRGQQVGVGAGTDRQVLADPAGGLGAPGVDDHDAPAALLDRTQHPGGVGDLHHRHLADQRVGAQAEEHLDVGEVGHRLHQRETVHLGGDVELGVDVDRVRGEDVGRAQRLDEARRHQGAGEGEEGRVALVHPDRARPVLVDQGPHPGADLAVRLFPGDRHQLAVDALERGLEPVLVVVQRAEAQALDAAVALRDGVLAVGADLDDPLALADAGAALDVDDQAAVHLADAAEGAHAAGHGP